MLKRMILMLVVVLMVIALLGFVKFRQVQTAMAQGAAFQPPPEAVTTIVAQQEDWPATLGAIGTMAAVQGVTVSADLPGIVDRIAFESGRAVRKGDVLAELDTRQERAQMAAIEAQRDLAAPQFDRMKGLLSDRVISQAEFDRAMAEQKQTDAQVGEIRATIARKTIRAPFSGVLGIRQVNLGQYLAAGDPIVPLQSLHPIYVNFCVPQQDVAQIRVGHQVQIAATDLGRRRVRRTRDRDRLDRRSGDEQRAGAGDARAIPAAGSGRACSCRPSCSWGRSRTVVALPASAINYAPFGDSVFIVTDLKGRGRAELSRRAPAVRQARRRARRSDRDRVGHQGRRGDRDLRRVQAAQRRGGGRQQQGAARQQARAEAGGQLRMRFTDLFVKRPVLAIVVNLVILIAGLQSIRALSVRQYPRSDIAVVRVSTAYVGANADLVRGFITTPLERVIASADGIDYMESSSAQGLSTITVHLRLNYDTNDALTQIQAKVAQVRNDLPPEAEAPIIEVENADTQFAALYLSFSSADLDQNQITDYLIRVVQPRLSAVSGVQRADILGDRTFAMRIWLKPDRMAAHGISPSMLREALARNNYLSALGRTKGSMVSVNLVANTDLRTPEEFRQLVVKEERRRRRPARRHRRRGARRGELRGGRPLQRSDRRLHGRLGPADGQLARRHPASPRGDSGPPGPDAGRDGGRHPLRRNRLHRGRHRRGPDDAHGNAAHRDRR